MSVDWITIAAQIVNFLVLIWLLKRFLYRPILDGIDRREAAIAARVAAAKSAREAAEAARAAHEAALATLAAEKTAILDAARTEAARDIAARREAARAALEAEQAAWRDQIAAGRAAYLARMRDVGARAIMTLAGKALKDLADADLEDRIAARVEARLADLAPALRDAAARAGEAVALSSFQLSPAREAGLRRALEAAAPGARLRFRVDPAASPGLALQLGGARVAWTIDAYLDELESALRARLDAPGPDREAAQ